MLNSFREKHILRIFEEYDTSPVPLDLFLSRYFRENKSVGSKDRAVICETVYGIIRWKGLLDYLIDKPTTWEKRVHMWKEIDPFSFASKEDIPPHIRVSFPKYLFDQFVESHGIENALKLCLDCNTPAPTTIRVNSLKITREEMIECWRDKYPIHSCEKAPHGIIFERRINFFELDEFKKGYFEVQDEGSQLLAELIKAKPGQHVLDYCAGSGGKTLAFGPKMNNKGQIFLHDIRSFILYEAKKRLRRAGIQNAQICPPNDPKLSKLKKGMDWVLVDSPCTGTGTLRRNTDMKWKFTEETLNRLVGQQRVIFEKALSFLKPDGRIVFGTCSLLNQENQDQISHFIKTYSLELESHPFQSLPVEGKMDGFYGAVMRRKHGF